jgi:hypothetical protein
VAETRHHTFRDSSRVDEATYDVDEKKILVTFVDGTQWVYEGVPFKEWTHFQASPSPGRFIDSLNRYDNHAA